MESIFVLVFLIFIVLDVLIAYEFYKVARYKGFEEIRYFIYPLLMPMIGYLLIIALPSDLNSDAMNGRREMKKQAKLNEQRYYEQYSQVRNYLEIPNPNPSNNEYKVPDEKVYGLNPVVAADDKAWICPVCERVNKISHLKCICGYKIN